jgi:putative PIN family toxin of toxin-antitoxin system
VLEALRRADFDLLISTRQRAELSDVLSRRRLIERFSVSLIEVQQLLALIDARAVIVPSSGQPLPVPVRDPKDERILASALDGNADYLVTGDNDLLVLAGHPALGRLQIVTAATFLAVLADA